MSFWATLRRAACFVAHMEAQGKNNQTFMENDMRSGGHPGNGVPPQTSPVAWAHLVAHMGVVDGAGTLAGIAYATAWAPRAAWRSDPI
jgi:hypothetical protein